MFDFSFKSFLTLRLIGKVYFLGLVLIGLAVLMPILFNGTQAWILLSLLGALPAAILWRIALEGIVVIYRIAENTRQLVELQKGMLPPAQRASAPS